VKLIKVECKNDKFAFMEKIRAIAKETQERVTQRVAFESQIVEVWQQGLSREQEKQVW
jgi:hypothetical protein